jgi:acetyl esterase
LLGQTLDPQVTMLLEQIQAQAAAQPAPQTLSSQQEEIAQTRQFMASTLAPLAIVSESVARVEDREIPGPGGKLQIRSYGPETDTPLPVLVYYHGGGFVAGDLDSCDTTARALANRSRCMVVSVEYRLAPEHPYPAANEDCWAALKWVSKPAAELGADARRLAVAGESAGGVLAAWVAQRAAKRGLPLRLQVLLCPILDATVSMRSWTELGTGEFLLAKAWMEDRVHAYLQESVDPRSPEVSPLLATELRGVAPAVIVTADHDPLHDEGEAYAEKLKAAGVQVDYICWPGTIHGLLLMAGVVDAGKVLVDQIGMALHRALA